MTLEQELLTATEVDPTRYKTRQKLLTAIVKIVDKLPEDKYQGLTDPALDWFQDAVKALKKKSSVPEFPDAEAEAEAAPPRDPEPEDKPEDDEEAEDDEEFDSEDEGALEAAEPEEQAVEPEAAEAEVAEPEPTPEPKKRGRGRPKKEPKPRKQDPIGTPTRYTKLSGNKNRYGIYEGTKLDEVCAMLEKGVTQAEIKEAVGDTKYNLVRRLKAEGHHVEHVGAKFTLTHKDDVEKPKGKKK